MRWEGGIVHFASINIPDGLVQAHAEGQVVFFVGAGASMGSPTSLPSFTDLTRRVADLASLPVPADDELKQPDVYLGSIDKTPGVDVHEHVKREIERGRRRNTMHDALARLAAAPGTIRLVTTNFDNFLHVALRAQKRSAEIHKAPGVPLGHRFEGIVHLHGHKSQPPRDLIVTDSDFGEAYITRGWAPTFLRGLFSAFVVCFVGYSHEDRMMDYFAKGLTSGARPRYIFTDRDEPAHWAALGITPITYMPHAHGDLVDALTRWSTWSSSTSYDRGQRVRLFNGGAPPSDPDDEDFLSSALEDPALVDEVCAVARGREWAQWMAAQTPIRALMDNVRVPSLDPRCVKAIAYWVAREGVEPGCWDVVHEAVLANGSKTDPVLVETIVWALMREQVTGEVPATWLRWVLGADLPEGSAGRGNLELLWASETVFSDQDTLLLIEKIVDCWSPPQLRTYGGVSGADITANNWRLRTGIKRRMLGSDSRIRRASLTWIMSFFEKAHRLVAEGERRFDPWSFSRSAIEPHEQDEGGLHESAGALIDLARDLLAAHRGDQPANARRIRHLWFASDAPLLRRIAIHDLRTDGDESLLAEKVEYLLDPGRLFDRDCRHEAYMLIADVAPQLDESQMEALIAAIVDGPPAEGDDSNEDPLVRYHDRKVYDLLHWILQRSPAAPRPAVLDEIESRHPEWLPRPHPDLDMYMETGSTSIEDEWPWKPQEFHAMIEADAEDALRQLNLQPRPDDGDWWWGGGDMLTRTTEQWPEDGLTIWGRTDDDRIRGRVIQGWASSDLSETQLTRIAELLLSTNIAGLVHSVVRLLIPWSNDANLRNRWTLRPDGRTLARKVFPYLASEGSNVTGTDLGMMAINSPVGQLAEYWAAAAIEEAREGTYPGGFLSEGVRTALEELLNLSQNPQLVEAALLRHLLFFHRADPTWANERLLTLLDPEARPWSESEPAWSVVLKGQVGENLLDAGVRDWLISCAKHVEPGSALRRDLVRWISIIAINSTMSETDRIEWLRRLVAVGDDELRAAWTGEIGRRFATLDDASRLAAWKQWMNNYVQRRLSGVPRNLPPSELTELVAWVAWLPQGPELTTGLGLLDRATCGIAPHGSWSMFPVSVEAIERAPEAWALLLAKLLGPTTEIGTGWGHDLEEILTFLKSNSVAKPAVNAVEAALFKLGIKASG